MGRLLAKCVGSSCLCMSMVVDVYHATGVWPVIQMQRNKCRRDCLNVSGIIFSSSFGTPSLRGALQFFNWDRKVCSRGAYDISYARYIAVTSGVPVRKAQG